MRASLQRRVVSFVTVVLLARAVSAESLPKDPRVVTGTLENGVTWMFRPHSHPPKRLALLLHIAAGSRQETDARRGLAHFVQHLVFEGSESFSADELSAYFRSIGMPFGCNVNAATGFDQTTYSIFLPGTEKGQVDEALKVLSGLAFRGLLREEAIEKVRQEILKEKRERASSFERVRDKLWPELFAGSRLVERMVVASEEAVRNTQRSELVDYYRTWYRPERVTLIMVGDADPEPYVPLIEKWFGRHRPTQPAQKARGAVLRPFTRQRAIVVTDPEYPRCQVALYDLRCDGAPTRTVAQARAQLVEEIGARIFFRHCHERAHTGEVGYQSVVTGVDNLFGEARLVTGVAIGEPRDWKTILEDLILEIAQARERGFSQARLDAVTKDMADNAARRIETEAAQNAPALLRAMGEAVTRGEPIMSPTQQADLLKRLLPTIELQEVNAAFKENFRPDTFAYVVMLPEKEGLEAPTREAVLRVVAAALKEQADEPVPAGP